MEKKRLLIGAVFLLLAAAFLVGEIFYNGKRQGNRADNHKPLKFGATYMTMNNPYFTALNESIREVVESNGDVLITRDPAQDQKRQNAQIQEMLDEGVAGIFVNPVDWEEITPALQACQKAQVPVFDVDTDVKDPQYVATVIQSDNYQAGVQCAKDMMSKRESARIVIMNHYNIRSTIQRVQGFQDTIEGHPEYQVVEEKSTTSELEVAMEVMKQILDTGLEFDVVLGANDPTALGALAALQMRHVENQAMIYGIDGSPDSKAMIRQGYMEGTSAQKPIQMGRISAQVAYDYLEGRDIEKNITVEVTLITRDNLDEFDVDGWQ